MAFMAASLGESASEVLELLKPVKMLAPCCSTNLLAAANAAAGVPACDCDTSSYLRPKTPPLAFRFSMAKVAPSLMKGANTANGPESKLIRPILTVSCAMALPCITTEAMAAVRNLRIMKVSLVKLKSQGSLMLLFIYVLCQTAVDDFAFGHDDKSLTDPAHQIQVLLHHQKSRALGTNLIENSG